VHDTEARLADLELQIGNARVITSAYQSIVQHLLGYIIHRDGEVGRSFVEGLKHHDGPLGDPHGEAGRARPDYAALFRATIDGAADAALSSRWTPNLPA
jgi:hypothetical protein